MLVALSSPLYLSVRSGQHDDSLRRSHTVHLDQQLIERVLALVVAAAGATVLAASATDGIDLILKQQKQTWQFE